MIGEPKSGRRRTRRPASLKKESAAPRRQAGSTPQLAVLYGQHAIRRRVRQLAGQINQDFAGTTLHLVGILERSFVFIADLVRQLEVPVVCHFLRVMVRDEWLEGVPLRRISYGPELRLSGKHVVLVDVILNTGVTLDYVRGRILAQKPDSLRVAALVEKADAKKVDVAADYLGFQTAGSYVVGYGLGSSDGQYRHLPWIATLC
jgi:hypoxanthine phosphoribosyltransferase